MQYYGVREIANLWGVQERKVTALARSGRIPGAKKEGKHWMVPSDSYLPLDGRTKAAKQTEPTDNESVVVQSGEISYTSVGGSKRVTAAFWEKYQHKPEYVAFTPYRICPVGAHVDHNLGKITGFAIDKGIHIAYGPKNNGVVELCSLQFPKRAQWHVQSVPDKQGDWADHLRGATRALNARYPLRTGICAVIDGELPIGGLSSSAAVIITFLSALCRLNSICLTEEELIAVSQEAENKYVGVSCGKLDQSCEIYCRRDHLLYMDMLDGSYERIPTKPSMPAYDIMILFSGVERSLAGTQFNMRVDELRSAAYALKGYAGMPYGKFEDTNLRDVPRGIFEAHKDKLVDSWRKRAEHWYSECERVDKAKEAWSKGDLVEFGKLCFESGKSSIENWETGSPELIKLYELLTETPGVYGGRFSGAGFKGCCVALVNPKKKETIIKTITKKYTAAFPHLADKFSIHICHSADGVRL